MNLDERIKAAKHVQQSNQQRFENAIESRTVKMSEAEKLQALRHKEIRMQIEAAKARRELVRMDIENASLAHDLYQKRQAYARYKSELKRLQGERNQSKLAIDRSYRKRRNLELFNFGRSATGSQMSKAWLSMFQLAKRCPVIFPRTQGNVFYDSGRPIQKEIRSMRIAELASFGKKHWFSIDSIRPEFDRIIETVIWIDSIEASKVEDIESDLKEIESELKALHAKSWEKTKVA